jgi:hypothetical protein
MVRWIRRRPAELVVLQRGASVAEYALALAMFGGLLALFVVAALALVEY